MTTARRPRWLEEDEESRIQWGKWWHRALYASVRTSVLLWLSPRKEKKKRLVEERQKYYDNWVEWKKEYNNVGRPDKLWKENIRLKAEWDEPSCRGPQRERDMCPDSDWKQWGSWDTQREENILWEFKLLEGRDLQYLEYRVSNKYLLNQWIRELTQHRKICNTAYQ